MDSFEYNGSRVRVLFGSGCRTKLPEELERLSLHKPLLVSTPGQLEKAMELAAILAESPITVACTFSKAAIHTPTSVTKEALEHAQHSHADSIVSIGGGSAISLGKAISIRTGLPHVAVPTTYAGSEMTPILGEIEGGRKMPRIDTAWYRHT